MTLVATVRGIPQLYYGSEIGMAGSKSAGDGDIRRDFPGGWTGDTNNAFTAMGRTATQQQFYDYTAKLFNWRKSKTIIHTGKTTHYAPENNTYVYFRYNEKESVMVIINNSDEKQTLKTKRFAENIGHFTSGSDAISGTSYDLSTEITIEAKSSLILELNNTTR